MLLGMMIEGDGELSGGLRCNTYELRGWAGRVEMRS